MIICISYSFILIVLCIWLMYMHKKFKSISLERDYIRKNSYKNQVNFNITTKFLYDFQNEHQIAKKMRMENYLNIAVYGMGVIGKSLVKELLENGINVSYAIDQNAELIYADVPVYNTENTMPKVDAIIVTTVYCYKQIKDFLNNKVDFPIISLNDFLI